MRYEKSDARSRGLTGTAVLYVSGKQSQSLSRPLPWIGLGNLRQPHRAAIAPFLGGYGVEAEVYKERMISQCCPSTLFVAQRIGPWTLILNEDGQHDEEVQIPDW